MVAVDGGAMVAPPAADRGDMSFELRAEISAGVAKLNGPNIQRVVDIIRQTMPGLGHDEREIEIDVNALDNATLWRLYDFIKGCQASRKPGRPKKGGSAAASRRDMMEDAARQTEQSLQNVRAARGALGGENSGGGIEDDWMDDGDSDDGFGGGGGAPSGIYDQFQNARLQKERQQQAQQQRDAQQQDQMRSEVANAKRSASERANAAQREREQQRQAERERRERENRGGIDMQGQSNMMASFENNGGDGDGDEFIFDEYSMGGF